MAVCSTGHMKRTLVVALTRSQLYHCLSQVHSPQPLHSCHVLLVQIIVSLVCLALDQVLIFGNSGLSLSPQPPELSHPFTFDYSTSLPNEFASSSSQPPSSLRLNHSPKSVTHYTSSRTGSGTADKKRSSKSRDDSPSRHAENDARRRFPCLIIGCERRFTSQYTLKVHMEAHKPKPRTSFPCTLGCNERFSRQHDRLRHEVAKHGKVCEFSCDECGRFFSTRKTLGNHKCPVAQGGTRWVTN